MEVSKLKYFQKHYKKILVVLSTAVALYFLHKHVYAVIWKKKKATKKKKREPLKEFPTIEEIQKFIEELPLDPTSTEPITLKDLLGDLSEFSEDEEWKELISSVHTLYKESPRPKL